MTTRRSARRLRRSCSLIAVTSFCLAAFQAGHGLRVVVGATTRVRLAGAPPQVAQAVGDVLLAGRRVIALERETNLL